MLKLLALALALAPVAAFAAHPELSEFSVQVGAYESVRNARSTRAFLESIGPARIDGMNNDKGQRQYRVLVGRFKNAELAEDFIRQYQLRKFFSGQWVNPVRVDHREVNEKVDQSPTDERTDPYQLTVNLMCPEDPKHRKGEYKAQFRPDPELKGSDVRLALAWDCSKPEENKPVEPPKEAKPFDENERNPSYASISLMAGFDSFSADFGGTGAASSAGFAYGAQLGLFRNLGAIGPVVEYRVMNRRLTSGDALDFSLEHRVQAGLRLMMFRQLDFEPLFGFYSLGFLTSTATAPSNQMTPTVGLRLRKALLEPRSGTTIDATAGYHQLFGTTRTDFNTLTGYLVTAQLRTRHLFESEVGGDWFIEYNYRSQDTSVSTQTESYFVAGATFMLLVR